jgi:hypothetical protein
MFQQTQIVILSYNIFHSHCPDERDTIEQVFTLKSSMQWPAQGRKG